MVQYFIIIMVSIFLMGCGKKGPVESLEPSEYPRTYPKPPPPDSHDLKYLKKKESSDDT